MKLIYKGNFKNESQLPKGALPDKAIKFKEPESPVVLNLVASLFIFPVLIICGVIIAFSFLLYGEFRCNFGSVPSILGVIMPFVFILPHELLHAVCFGKNAEVQLYISLKNLMAFVVSTQPVSKSRFIFLSLLPNVVFGWIPFLLWAFVPFGTAVSSFLFPFSLLSILFGSGDYLNIYNALRQMPKGSIQQLSGFNSYWYMP